MNKLELVDALKEKSGLNKSEAAVVVDVFFMKCPMRLQKVIGLKSVDYAHSM